MKHRKMQKLTRILTMAIAMFAMLVGTITTVSAEDAPYPVINGTEDNPAKAYLSKTLKLADGITTPTASFKFVFTGISKDDDTSIIPPTIADKTISYTATDTTTVNAQGIKEIKKLTSDDILKNVDFTQTGIYKYKVVETANTYSLGNEESMEYSKASYTVEVHVVNGTNKPYVKYIVVTKVTKDDGTTASGKVDGSGDVTNNGFTFTNVFRKDGNAGATSALEITNTVTGAYADKTKDFEYKLNITKSPTAPSTETTYTAIIKDTDGSTQIGQPIVVTPGTEVTFYLKHGQKLVFAQLPAGSKYTVVQSATPNYTPSVSIVVNGGTPIVTNKAKGDELSSEERLIGEKVNKADFVNTNDGSTVTGILDSNLPFVLLIGVALLGFGGYVFGKTRRNAK